MLHHSHSYTIICCMVLQSARMWVGLTRLPRPVEVWETTICSVQPDICWHWIYSYWTTWLQ